MMSLFQGPYPQKTESVQQQSPPYPTEDMQGLPEYSNIGFILQ